MQLVPVFPKPGVAPCKSFTSVGCAQQFLLELRRRRTFRARGVSQTSIQMMRPDELFGKDKGSLRRDSSCQNQKEKTMPNTVSTQAISDLGPKLVRAEQALTAIPPGSRIYLGTGCAAPRKLLATLEAMSPGPADLEVVSFVTTSAVSEEASVARTRYRHRTFFVGSDLRGLARSGQLDYGAHFIGGRAGAPGERKAADRRGAASGIPSR